MMISLGIGLLLITFAWMYVMSENLKHEDRYDVLTDNGLLRYPTKTGDWCLAVHRVSSTGAEIWFGSLCATVEKPKKARLVVQEEGGDVVTIVDVYKHQWKKPFRRLEGRFYFVAELEHLKPGTSYKVRFDRSVDKWLEHDGTADALIGYEEVWQDMCSGCFKTLPSSIPSFEYGSFTIASASCFYRHVDAGRAASAFKSLYQNGYYGKHKPDIKFLTGDQVYVDIGLDSLSFKSKDIRRRIADDYEKQWQALGDLLRSGGTWMVPDDHEYWNDYPFYKTPIPTLWPLLKRSVRKAWASACIDGVKNIQRSSKVEVFNIGNDLSFCIYDSRSYRHDDGFIDEDGLCQIEKWATGLKCPGVIVSSQLLISEPEGLEKNIASFKEQHARLLSALSVSGHDIISLTGDVHFGRISKVALSDESSLIEVVTSPLSNLTGLEGIATNSANSKPKYLQINGIDREVEYFDSEYFVPTENPELPFYPKKRTSEHFSTLSFCMTPDGLVVEVQSWKVRHVSSLGVPSPIFQVPFVYHLN